MNYSSLINPRVFCSKAASKVSVLYARTRIKTKWRRDISIAPLQPEHKALYESIHLYHYQQLRQFPDVAKPLTYNDKIAWLQLFDQDRIQIVCTDKLRVRDFVSDMIGCRYLNTLYGNYRTFDEIPIAELPDSFVLKTNHDSGSVFLINNKNEVAWHQIKASITNALQGSFGEEKGEWAYSRVEPCIIVEKHLSPGQISPPPDYKLHCVNGKVRFIQYIFDRGHGTKEIIFDKQWNRLPLHLDWNFKLSEQMQQPPESLEEMIAVAEKLAEKFKYVRVDLYEVNGAVVFGEMTFFPYAGCYKSTDVATFGEMLDFDLKSVKPPVYHLLKRTWH